MENWEEVCVTDRVGTFLDLPTVTICLCFAYQILACVAGKQVTLEY